MRLSALEEHVLAYYLANAAEALQMDPRFWPYGELILIVEDKIGFATRAFGFKVGRAAPNAARAFLDLMIERGGFSTAKNDYGSTMHQYQKKRYEASIRELQVVNPICMKANAAGPEYWETAFSELTNRE